MKRINLVLLALATIGIFAIPFTFGQAKRGNSVEAEIIALEKQAFEAWKNKDRKFFEEAWLAGGVAIAPSGMYTKEQWARLNSDHNCTVKSYALDNTKVTMLNKEMALLTFRFSHDTICNGKPEPSPVWASTLFVKRGKKWLAIFHQETNAEAAK